MNKKRQTSKSKKRKVSNGRRRRMGKKTTQKKDSKTKRKRINKSTPKRPTILVRKQDKTSQQWKKFLNSPKARKILEKSWESKNPQEYFDRNIVKLLKQMK